MALTAPAFSEVDLVRRAQNGDRASFGALYETYLSRIFDYTLGMLRNRSDAEDATSSTFLKAVERLGDLRDSAAFKGWLYAIARNETLRIVEGRKKATPVAEHHESSASHRTAVALQPEESAEGADLRELLDEAAATLSERDRNVFELTVRHGMGSAEVARVLDVRPAYAYILVNRAKGSITEAMEAIILARVGRADCPELAELVNRFAGEVSPRMRKAVSRHARGCEACGATKRRRASLPALLQGVAFAEPAATFAAQLAASIDTHWSTHAPQGPTSSSGIGAGQVAGTAALVVVFAAAIVGGSPQRTLVEVEQGPSQPVRDVASWPAGEPADDPKPQMADAKPDPVVAARPARNEGSRVTVTKDSGTGRSNDGGSTVSNSSDVQTDSGSDGDDSIDEGDSKDEPNPNSDP